MADFSGFCNILFIKVEYNCNIFCNSCPNFLSFKSLHNFSISFKYLLILCPIRNNLFKFKLCVKLVARIPQNSPYNLVLVSINILNLFILCCGVSSSFIITSSPSSLIIVD